MQTFIQIKDEKYIMRVWGRVGTKVPTPTPIPTHFYG